MAATISEKNKMNKEDNEMIETPWGKKRWGTIRQAFEQRDELIEALNNLAVGLVDYMNDDEAELPDVSEAIELVAKVTSEPVMAA
jgi:hypothetical protein